MDINVQLAVGMVRGLEYMRYKERLREQGLFSQQKCRARWQGCRQGRGDLSWKWTVEGQLAVGTRCNTGNSNHIQAKNSSS